jgi:hypothetical protein
MVDPEGSLRRTQLRIDTLINDTGLTLRRPTLDLRLLELVIFLIVILGQRCLSHRTNMPAASARKVRTLHR